MVSAVMDGALLYDMARPGTGDRETRTERGRCDFDCESESESERTED
jgi:hypothetical protein